MKKIAFALLLLAASCQKELNYKLDLPVYEVTNLLPADNTTLDLNNLDVNEYEFSWSVDNPEEQLLLISEDPMLASPIYIEVGRATSYTMSSLELDGLLVKLNIKANESKKLYWSIKSKADPQMASRQISSLIGRRALSRLDAPADLTKIAVYRETLDQTVAFAWNTEGMATSETYTVCMGLKQDLSGKIHEIEVGTSCPANLTYAQLQTAFEQLECPEFETAELYWNVRIGSSGNYLSRSSSIIYLDGILEFTDVRGDESITYRVAKTTYSSGKTVVWLADNLRTGKYPDGTDLDSTKDYIQVDADTSTERFLAYGRLYPITLGKRLVPEGWRLPSVADYEELFAEAAKVPGSYNVLKDNRWYGDFPRENGHVNEWRMNLNSAGRLPNGVFEIWGYASKYCYLLVSDMDDKVILHDNGDELWKSANDGAVIRLIYVGNK